MSPVGSAGLCVGGWKDQSVFDDFVTAQPHHVCADTNPSIQRIELSMNSRSKQQQQQQRRVLANFLVTDWPSTRHSFPSETQPDKRVQHLTQTPRQKAPAPQTVPPDNIILCLNLKHSSMRTRKTIASPCPSLPTPLIEPLVPTHHWLRFSIPPHTL